MDNKEKYVKFTDTYDLPPNITKGKKYKVIEDDGYNVKIEKDNKENEFYRHLGKFPVVTYVI